MLTEKERKQLGRIEKILAMPKWKYYLVHGILYTGVPFAISMTIVYCWMQDEPANQPYGIGRLLFSFVFNAVFFGIAMNVFSLKGYRQTLRYLKEKETATDQ